VEVQVSSFRDLIRFPDASPREHERAFKAALLSTLDQLRERERRAAQAWKLRPLVSVLVDDHRMGVKLRANRRRGADLVPVWSAIPCGPTVGALRAGKIPVASKRCRSRLVGYGGRCRGRG
jgi:hypothetical protein